MYPLIRKKIGHRKFKKFGKGGVLGIHLILSDSKYADLDEDFLPSIS